MIYILGGQIWMNASWNRWTIKDNPNRCSLLKVRKYVISEAFHRKEKAQRMMSVSSLHVGREESLVVAISGYVGRISAWNSWRDLSFPRTSLSLGGQNLHWGKDHSHSQSWGQVRTVLRGEEEPWSVSFENTGRRGCREGRGRGPWPVGTPGAGQEPSTVLGLLCSCLCFLPLPQALWLTAGQAASCCT